MESACEHTVAADLDRNRGPRTIGPRSGHDGRGDEHAEDSARRRHNPIHPPIIDHSAIPKKYAMPDDQARIRWIATSLTARDSGRGRTSRKNRRSIRSDQTKTAREKPASTQPNTKGHPGCQAAAA